MTDLKRLISSIETAADSEGEWSLDADEQLELLGIDTVEYLRNIYRHRDRVNSLVLKTIDRDSIVTFIRGICPDLGACERLLYKSGVIFSVEQRSELTHFFVEAVVTDAASHQIDNEAIDGMRVRAFNDRIAIDRYIEFFFDPKSHIDDVSTQFVTQNEDMIASIAEATARSVLHELFSRHLLSVDTLLEGVRDRLRSYCGISDSLPNRAIDPDLKNALADLGLDTLPPRRDDIKRIYRSLMKTYHPDINSAGLEMSQRITRAYAIVTSTMESR